MANTWDSLMKRLTQASPQDLVSWIFPDALYTGVLNTELQKDPVRADLMYTVMCKGQQVALHVEFQKQQDDNMGRRVWQYNVLTCVRTGLPVYSVVLYLVKDRSIVEPPYTIELPTGDIVHQFVFQNIKLWELPPEALLEQNLPGLLPLLPLTQEGKRRGVVGQMIRSLQQNGNKELLALGFAFADLVLEQESDQQWLEEIFINMEDILEESRMFQRMEQKGSLRELRLMLTRLTEARFPDLVSQVQKQAEQTNSQEQLRTMIDKLFTATTEQEARNALIG